MVSILQGEKCQGRGAKMADRKRTDEQREKREESGDLNKFVTEKECRRS